MAPSLHNRTRRQPQGPVFIDTRHGTAPQISVRFDLATMEALRAIANAEQRPIALIIRRLVADAMGRVHAE